MSELENIKAQLKILTEMVSKLDEKPEDHGEISEKVDEKPEDHDKISENHDDHDEKISETSEDHDEDQPEDPEDPDDNVLEICGTCNGLDCAIDLIIDQKKCEQISKDLGKNMKKDSKKFFKDTPKYIQKSPKYVQSGCPMFSGSSGSSSGSCEETCSDFFNGTLNFITTMIILTLFFIMVKRFISSMFIDC